MRNAKGQFVSQGKIIEKNCLTCGNGFKTYLSANHKYCSCKCYTNSLKGRKRPNHSKFMKGKNFRKGIPLTKEHRLKLSGENSPRWKGGITPLYHKIRRLPEFNKWRLSVYEKDLFTCQMCKKSGIRLECHHIKSLAYIIKKHNIKTVNDALSCRLLWDKSNGKTLCKECHKLTDSYGNNKIIG